MANEKRTQEASRKYGGSSSFNDVGQPSKAPLQDEDNSELEGTIPYRPHQVNAQSEDQGISNRPVKEEHAFPKADAATHEPPDEDLDTPKQQGGTRGGV
jgi:hypothetical protein